MKNNPGKYEIVNCPLCNCRRYEILCKKGQFNLPLNVSICKDCGFVYLNPRWTKDRYVNFYEYEYDKCYRPEELSCDRKGNNRYERIRQIVERLKKNNILFEHSKRIFEIGSGMGWNLEYLKNNYCKEASLYAIELSVNSKKSLSELNIYLLAKDIDSEWQTYVDSEFDFIIMRHVLEHCLEPISTLRKVHEVLSNDGILYIAIPNLIKPDLPLSESHFRVVHTMYFSKNSINSLLSKCGFKTLFITEGDQNNPYEIFLVCKKSNITINNHIGLNDYRIVKEHIVKHLVKENAIL